VFGPERTVHSAASDAAGIMMARTNEVMRMARGSAGGGEAYFAFTLRLLNRFTDARISRFASSGLPHSSTFTHLPGSRSL
jgi:hypothetical protein